MGQLCEGNPIENYEVVDRVIYGVLFVEFLMLIFYIVYFLFRSCKIPQLDFSEYKLYLCCVLVSSLLKEVMFAYPCADYGLYILIFPYFSSQTVLIYMW
jgi:hypothetical protein